MDAEGLGILLWDGCCGSVYIVWCDLSTLFGTKNSHNPQIFYATFDFSSSHHLISASIGER